jgi:hypothetical protein
MCHLQDLHAKYEGQGLVILGCNASDDKEIALEMLAENGATFPNIIDSSDAATKVCCQQYQGAYGFGVPLSYIIDRDGKIVDGWYGGKEMHSKAMAALHKMGGELAEAIRQDIAAKRASKSAPRIAAAAARLFAAIRAADYNANWLAADEWKRFPAKDQWYEVGQDRLGWVRWVCEKFKHNPIVEVQLGAVAPDAKGLPAIHFKLRLKDGEVLQGDLPFKWDSQRKQWVGQKGLDWHLPKLPAKEPKG